VSTDDPTDGGGFLRRWSLRKQAVRTAETAPDAPAAEDLASPVQPDPDEPEASPPESSPPDLPDVESLDASSDYRAFLDRAVPRDLRVAALRKAWATDPVIAGYRPLADYDWDFNAPGYAALRPTDDPAKFVAALFRHLQPPDEPAVAGADGAPPFDGDSPAASRLPQRNPAPTGGFDGYPQVAEREAGMALTLDEIRAVLGPIDPQVAAEIVRLDPTMEDLQAAKAWMLADEALANDHRSPPSGNVARLIDLLASQGLQDPDETDGAPLA
jgi:hypothetical protein